MKKLLLQTGTFVCAISVSAQETPLKITKRHLNFPISQECKLFELPITGVKQGETKWVMSAL